MADAPKQPDRGDVESAILDAMGDVRVLDIVLDEAGQSRRGDDGAGGTVMLVPHDAFLAWRRACDHLAASVREVERAFYERAR